MRRLALPVGPLLLAATLLLPAPAELAPPAWRVAGLAAWMALWWLTACVPLEATALLPIGVLPLVGGGAVGRVTAAYGDPIIFLFLGGFFLAATLERWDLHRRFALTTVHAVGTRAPRVVLAFLLASAAVSMWISNTATALMMLPIAGAVVAGSVDGGGQGRFPTALMLAVAYGASIGGVATLIGTPPNAIFAAAARELGGVEVGFDDWLSYGLPVTVPMLVGCWLLLVRLFDVRGDVPGLADAIARERHALGPLRGAERFVLAVFAATALAWILREPKVVGTLRIPGLTDLLPGVSDTGIAVAAALLLFVTPLRRSRFPVALNWETARRVPWGILLLFGGGLALAAAFERNGLTAWIGGRLVGLAGAPLPVVLLATTVLFVFLTELTSNSATAAIGMPLMAGVAGGLGVAALPLMTAAAIGSSMAFMLPVATPPNAILFGSGEITAGDMARAGMGLNAIAIGIITVVVWVRVG
jgi:sodium-dependent dicarboxylate transporter 2/3/5